MFLTEINDSLIIAIELCLRDLFSIYLKTFGNIYKVRRSEKSDFFSKVFPEYLREHLTDTSFSIASCDMEYS